MYLDHFSIKEKPFQIDIDKRYLWIGGNLSHVVSAVKNAIFDDNGIILLSGDAGTGKTLLTRWIADEPEHRFVFVTIDNPDLGCLEFFRLLSDRFELQHQIENRGIFLLHFRKFLRNTYAAQKKIVLIIDDAHDVKIDLLKELALLAEIKMNNQRMVTILLAGQKKMLEIVKDDALSNLANNITFTCEVAPLSKNETIEYVSHRLAIAAAQNNIFTGNALQEVFSFSQGNPRMINIICDYALMIGFKNDKKQIDTEVIKECRRELTLEARTRNRNIFFKELGVTGKTQRAISDIPKEPSAKRFRFVAALLLVAILFTYLLYNAKTNSSSRWEIEELVPSTYDIPALKEKESLTQKIETKSNQLLKNKKNTIYFQHNSNELSDDALNFLDSVAQIMIHYPDKVIEIRGYTDSYGATNYNVKISKFRAEVVKSYLVAKGISPTRMNVLGMGPKDPLYPNKTKAGRRLNRRVEIEFLSGE